MKQEAKLKEDNVCSIAYIGYLKGQLVGKEDGERLVWKRRERFTRLLGELVE